MYVNHSGWSQELGSFHYDIFLDETKTDYELHFADGFVSKQTSPFEEITADWNCDGDWYTQFGAWFESPFGGSTFWTPVQMISELIESREEGRRHSSDRLIAIPGIQLPERKRKETLESMISQTEKRTFQKEIERNRKMEQLGVLPLDEPRTR